MHVATTSTVLSRPSSPPLFSYWHSPHTHTRLPPSPFSFPPPASHPPAPLQCCDGGELFEHITKSASGFTERQAAQILRSLMQFLAHMHGRGLAHMDIKVGLCGRGEGCWGLGMGGLQDRLLGNGRGLHVHGAQPPHTSSRVLRAPHTWQHASAPSVRLPCCPHPWRLAAAISGPLLPPAAAHCCVRPCSRPPQPLVDNKPSCVPPVGCRRPPCSPKMCCSTRRGRRASSRWLTLGRRCTWRRMRR